MLWFTEVFTSLKTETELLNWVGKLMLLTSH